MGKRQTFGNFGSRWQPAFVAAAVLITILTLNIIRLNVHAQGAGQHTVQVRSHPVLGEILVGPDGMTLYIFAFDEEGVSNCTEGCAVNWPPLVVTGELVAPPESQGQLGILVREADEYRGRILQVTYKGKPLYYWSRDKEPGDTTGHGIGDLWFVASP